MTEPTSPARPRRHLLRAVLVPLLLAAVVGAAAGGPGWIRVRRGDTLSELALRYHTTVKALRELNDVPGNNMIYEGQLLRVGTLPVVVKRAPAKHAAPAKPRYKRVPVVYVVRPGDGVIRIAARYKKDPRWIVAHNRLPKNLMLFPDQRLVVDIKTVRIGPPPLPETRERELPVVGVVNEHRLLVLADPPPLVKTVRRNEAPAIGQRVTERGLRPRRFRSSVDHPGSAR